MAQSGWYDDPDGTVGRLRYWDGSQWTSDIMAKPAGVPQAPADSTSVLPTAESTAVLPPQPTGPQQGPYAPAGSLRRPTSYPQAPQASFGAAPGHPVGQPGRPPRRTGVGIAVAAVALLLLVGLAVAVNGLLRPVVPPATASPGTSTTSSSKAPTVGMPSVTVPGQSVQPTIPDPSDGQSLPAACPAPSTSTLSDGTISVSIPDTWTALDPANVDWADCPGLAGRDVTARWMTSAIVGTAAKDGKDAKLTAQDAWDWNVETNYESPTTQVRVTSDKVTASEAVTIGGKSGYKLTGTVNISGLSGVSGDDVTVLVLDHADGTHSVLITMSTIGDAASKADVAAVWSSLKVA